MDTITFEIDDITIQLVNGEALFWIGPPDNDPDIVLPINKLRQALSTADMLMEFNR